MQFSEHFKVKLEPSVSVSGIPNRSYTIPPCLHTHTHINLNNLISILRSYMTAGFSTFKIFSVKCLINTETENSKLPY